MRATNEFQIVEDLPPSPGYGVTSQAALTQFAEIAPPTSLAKSRNALCILWYHVHNF